MILSIHLLMTPIFSFIAKKNLVWRFFLNSVAILLFFYLSSTKWQVKPRILPIVMFPHSNSFLWEIYSTYNTQKYANLFQINQYPILRLLFLYLSHIFSFYLYLNVPYAPYVKITVFFPIINLSSILCP